MPEFYRTPLVAAFESVIQDELKKSSFYLSQLNKPQKKKHLAILMTKNQNLVLKCSHFIPLKTPGVFKCYIKWEHWAVIG